MKKHIAIFAILAMVIVSMATFPEFSKTSCASGSYTEIFGNDPYNFLADGTQVTAQEFELAIVKDLLADTYDPALAAHYGLAAPSGSASSSKAATTSSKAAAPAKEKVTVYFTDMFGEVIGTSQVTKGTDIAESQFPQTVEDIEHEGVTYTFDSWDYDGHVMEHQYIVRANYVAK